MTRAKHGVVDMLFRSLLMCVATAVAAVMPANAQTHDGTHDFDFEIGTWHTHLKRLAKPLTGSNTWIEYDGTTVVAPVLNGRANLVELVADVAGGGRDFERGDLGAFKPGSPQGGPNFSDGARGGIF